MRLLPNPALLDFNINHTHDIDTAMQTQLRLGNTQFIVECAQELKVQDPALTASVAILYMQLFYLEQSYLENEREMLCCAALFVAGKLLY